MARYKPDNHHREDSAISPMEQPGGNRVTPSSIARFKESILSFYGKEGRDLPWRHMTDPYHILVSEIMLQQTQVERVIKKYPVFIAAFPTVTDLAKSPLSHVLNIWQGMGYNRRAIALQACARKVVEEHGGRLPPDIDILETFPGIGKSTANSIAVFAFNLPAVFIETNIRRVFIHCFFDSRDGISDHEILPLVELTLFRENPRVWYSALMDYGTKLKKMVPNPNRRSAHYTRQPSFKGSDRQIRGMVLRQILLNPYQDDEILIQNIGQEPDRVRNILTRLLEEGFLIRNGLGFRIKE